MTSYILRNYNQTGTYLVPTFVALKDAFPMFPDEYHWDRAWQSYNDMDFGKQKFYQDLLAHFQGKPHLFKKAIRNREYCILVDQATPHSCYSPAVVLLAEESRGRRLSREEIVAIIGRDEADEHYPKALFN